MKYISIIIILLFILKVHAQTPLQLNYKLRNFAGKEAVLYAVKGSENIPLDTSYTQNGNFTFNNIQKYPTGVYRVRFNDTLFTEVIFNQEEIILEADANEVLRTMDVKKSIENQILFDYWKNAMDIRDTLIRKFFEKDAEMKRNQNQPNKITKQIDREIDFFNDGMYNYTVKLKEYYPNTFACKLLRAYQMPSYRRYLAEKGNEPYPDEKLFYLYHFFDYIDFSDPRLLNSKVIFTAINDYLKTFANPAKTDIYIDLINRIMVLASSNQEVHDYVVMTFIKAFEFSIWDDVFIHVIDNYYLKSKVSNPYLGVFYANKVAVMKRLKIGNVFPNLSAKDTLGNEIQVNSVNAKAKMIVFYSSDCEHCLETLPTLRLIYEDYKEDGLVVIAIALDDNPELWKKIIKEYKLGWISISDMKGMLSPYLSEYNIWSTPKILLLDKENIIRGIPNGDVDIQAGLLQLLHLQK